ncbi:helix-turn-helix transcriptional regulator [Kitasatospora cineracea]|uniref:ArsR family transcriptional regulator n=1 Tax=Kitasatospora cineracea TaxID=88074 RepID=A0A3N4RFC6_9ACTN|nr:putative ArsR family transcriptional regulator [Kitasatospora cineracea]
MKNIREHKAQPGEPDAPGCAVPATAAEALAEGHRATRDRVARSILDHGPSSAADLASRLGLTPAAVRRHLDGLAAAGLVDAREQRVYGSRGRGRPAKVFALTDSGRSAFYQAYDQLAADALRWISEAAGGGSAGEEAVAAFARARLAKQGERYQDALDQAGAQRAEALAEALSADGYAATVRRVPSAAAAPAAPAGAQLCQHHCPVAHIAEQFPQLCEAETEVFSQLLGTHVQRLATIAHGDGVCTTYVPASGAAPSSSRTPGAAPTAGTSPNENGSSARRNLA